MSLSERIPVLVTPEQREHLERVARQQQKSVGAVVRAALDAYVTPRSRSRREALDELFALEAPVQEWPEIKAEIIAGRDGRDHQEVLRALGGAGQRGD